MVGGLEGRGVMPFHQAAAGGAGSQAIASFEGSGHRNFKFQISNEKLRINLTIFHL
jgi:hypothetical protein